MSNPFVGEIRLVGFNFAPAGWAFCQGQLLSIAQNTALFSVLGTYYGGDGRSTFALPDLQDATVMGTDQSGVFPYVGESGGAASVTLTQTQIPSHTHGVLASPTPGTTSDPNNASFAIPRVGRVTEAAYGTAGSVPLAPNAFAVTGGNQPHNNMQPSLALNYIIALQGVYPPRS
ncbi:phage tail protein [Leifsonia naganoensis]|uniref:Microcystin-dependent protein n=1 Tax=Leifsonia naganoensis TaxID=150025 RepID=A0A853DMD3_9MICO|nr:tail fiber protein [Leifsonia naganoensis]NYK10236.1 microcystin-dependent protein [Leifsonia naganoensis]